MSLIARKLPVPKDSFFLFGPRGTGKSTWLKQNMPSKILYYNLLLSKDFLRLQQKPSTIRNEVLALDESIHWVVIDEVQKIPILLDEVHALIEDFPNRYKFALTGSSARKLKSADANLLAGRALTRHFYPFSMVELQSQKISIEAILRYGMLPRIAQKQLESSSLTKELEDELEDILASYCETYLREEIQREAATRNLLAFNRFLNVSSNLNGQVLNFTQIASDVGVSRSTVQNYFQILVDTLLGFILPAYQGRFRVKEVDHPKFYYFDTGVCRTLSGRSNRTLDSLEKGMLFETYMIHEIRAAKDTLKLGGELFYWRSSEGAEVDLLWLRNSEIIGIEFKAAEKWNSKFSKHLKILMDEKKIHQGHVVYLGDKSAQDGQIKTWTWLEFLESLWNKKI